MISGECDFYRHAIRQTIILLNTCYNQPIDSFQSHLTTEAALFRITRSLLTKGVMSLVYSRLVPYILR